MFCEISEKGGALDEELGGTGRKAIAGFPASEERRRAIDSHQLRFIE